MNRVRHFQGLVLATAGLLVFGFAVPPLYERPRPVVSTEMEVALPRFVQVLMAAGDRYLAANLAGFRALVVSTEQMVEENYRVLGIVQSDVAWFNPAHEDNYYIASAILPWNGEVAVAQDILRKATSARPFDWQPPFYYAFNALHFLKRTEEGVEWLRIAARHTHDEMEQIGFEQMAAQWVSRGEDKTFAIKLHRAMAKETKMPAFARFLEKRAVRLENQLLIETAVQRYTEFIGHRPRDIHELVEGKFIRVVPDDPFGQVYTLDHKGDVIVARGNTVGPKGIQ